jgi:hypothetical protein
MARTIYVSPSGDDTTGQGTSRRPFRTIERARSLIRARGYNVSMTADQIVSLAPGEYWDVGTSTFTEADSGSNGFNVVYQVDGDPGDAKLYGGRVVTDWTLHSGSIYKTPLPGKVYTLWENGRRAHQARFPKLNPGVSYPNAYAPYFLSTGVANSPTLLGYDTNDIDPSGWNNLADVSVVVWSQVFLNTAWFTDHVAVASVDTGTNRLTLAQKMKFYGYSSTAARYFVQGDLTMLTEPGEFVCSGGWLYYWPRDGAIASQEIVVPTVQDVISLKGNDTSTPVADLQFDGLEIQYSDFVDWYRFGVHKDDQSAPWDYGYQRQNENVEHALIRMENVDGVQVTRCHLKNSGLAGIYQKEWVQNCNIEDTWVEHAGSSCIYSQGRSPGLGDILKNNRYWNIKTSEFGEIAGDGSGIHINQSGGNVLRYILIENGPRYGLELSGWGHDDHPNYTTNNDGKYIKVTGVGQDSGDMGAITINFLDRTGVNYLDQILIDAIHAHASMLDVPPNAAFCDNESDGQHLSNVWATNIQNNQFRTNDSPAGTHVLTNCSFLSNGLPNPDFDSSLVDVANIGVTSSFPF